MSVTEETVRLILETKGQGSVEDLEESLRYTRATLGQLKSAYDAAEISQEEFLKTGNRLARQETELANILGAVEDAERQVAIATKQANAEMERATIAAGKATGAHDKLADSTTKATNKMAGLGQAGLQSGRVIQDFAQGGIGGVLNNIEGFTQAIGGGPGLAGGLTALGVGFFLLKPYIADFFASLQGPAVKEFTGSLDTLQDKLKELTDKPHKMKVDLDNIETVKQQLQDIAKGLAAAEAAKSGRTAEEKAAGDRFTKTFEETGGEGKAAYEAAERQAGDAAVANDKAVKATSRALSELRQQIDATDAAMKAAEAAGRQALAIGDTDAATGYATEARNQRAERDRLTSDPSLQSAIDRAAVARKNARARGEAEVGNTFNQVKQGNNPTARENLAGLFRDAGQDRFARMVDNSAPETPAQAADRQHAIEVGKDLEKKNAKVLADIKARPGLNLQNTAKEAKSTFGDADSLLGHLNRIGVGLDKADVRAAAKADKKSDAEIDKAAKAADKALETRATGMKGLELQAQGAIAQHLQGGGSLDANGQLSMAAFGRIRDMVSAELKRQNPGMNPLTRGALASKVAGNAEKGLNQKLVNANSQTQSNVQALLSVASQLDAEVTRLRQQAGMQGQQIQQLARKGQARSRTNLRRP